MRRRPPIPNLRAGFDRISSGSPAVLVGGLIGSALRVGVGGLIPDRGFPTSTLVVNLVGALAIGVYLGRRERAVVQRGSVDLWAIGLLGSLTTFSAFSVEAVELLAGGRATSAALYVGISVMGGLWLAFVGNRFGALAR